MRNEDQLRHLRAMERSIRSGKFSHSQIEDPEVAVKRLYLTGTIESNGPTDRDGQEYRQFEAMWQLNSELAKSIDWSRIGSSEDKLD